MIRPTTYRGETREGDRPAFFQLGNETLDVFQPIMGPHCFTIYAHLVRRAFRDPELKHSVWDLKKATNLGVATISRSCEVLEHLGLIELTRCGGSQKSKCKLLDPVEAAERLGSTYQKRTLSWSLPTEIRQRLEGEVEEIRRRQQGKPVHGELSLRQSVSDTVSQRNACVPPTISQPVARETQSGLHLLEEEIRTEEDPSPTPSQRGQSQYATGLPDEDGPYPDLRWACVKFTGVIDEMRDHLLETSRPQVRNLVNGAADWSEFGFNSLAVEAARSCGDVLVLTLSASDATATRRGLDKYHRTWERSLGEWFQCEVRVELVPVQGAKNAQKPLRG